MYYGVNERFDLCNKKKKVFYEMRKEMKLLHTILFASMVMNMFREICFKDTLHN